MKNQKFNSIIFQAAYVLITGLICIFIPNVLLDIFGFEPTKEVWIKVLGVVLIALAITYYGIVKNGSGEVAKYTIYGRLFATFGFILLAVTGQAPLTLILFGLIDAATAVWTYFELKKG